MPILEAYRYLPGNVTMLTAFDLAKQNHPDALKKARQFGYSKSPEEMDPVVRDFMMAGVAFLANNGHHELVRESGAACWQTISNQSLKLLFTNSIPKTLYSLGAPISAIAEGMKPSNQQAVITFDALTVGNLVMERGNFIVGIPFIQLAIDRPLDSLAILVLLFSQVRDFANGRFIADRDNFAPRAAALQADFLLEVKREHPEYRLVRLHREVLSRFPNGLASLPNNLQYSGISFAQMANASSN